MKPNATCSLCSHELCDRFCVCSNLPLLGPECWSLHKTKEGFHFSLPIAAREYVTAQNQRQFTLWLTNLDFSQRKLRETLPRLDECCREIEASYEGFVQEVLNKRDQLISKLQEWKAALTALIDAAVEETSANAYRSDYVPSSQLAALVWNHCRASNSEELSLFAFEVRTTEERLRDPLEISIRSTLAELPTFESGGALLVGEMRDLLAKCEQLQAEMNSLSQQRTHKQNDPSLVPVLKGNSLTLYHPRTLQPTHITLSTPSDVDERTACCYINEDTLLCCGGGVYPNVRKKVWKVEIGSSAAERVNDMSEVRRCAGLWKYRDSVYAFGGSNGRQFLTSGEKYGLESKLWTTLRNSFQAGKNICSVCELSDSLYVSGIGGGQSTIERFDPKAETFTPFSTHNSMFGSILCSDGNSLYCIHDGTVQCGDANGAFAVISTFPVVGSGQYWLRCPLQWTGELTSVFCDCEKGRMGLFRFSPAQGFSEALVLDD